MYPAFARFFVFGGMALHSRLGKQIFAGIRGSQLFQFFHQIANAFIGRLRHHDLNLHIRVAARAFPHTRHTFFLQPQRAPAIRSGRNAHQRAPIDRWHFDLRPERSFRNRDGHLDVNVVAAPFEEVVGFHNHTKVQVACRRAHRAGIAFAGNAHAPATIDARGNAHIDRFGLSNATLTAAGGTRAAQFAGPAAAIAGHVEAHFPSRLLERTRAVTCWAGLRGTDGSRAMTGPARIEPRNLKLLYRAAHGIPEINFDLVFQIAARFFLRFHRCRAAPPAKKLAEQISETGAALLPAEIEATKIEIDVLLARVVAGTVISRRHVVAVEAVLVVHLTFLGIGKNVVGFLELFELFFRSFVAGVQVWVVFAGQLSKRGADIFGAGFARHAENLVVILFCAGSHIRVAVAGDPADPGLLRGWGPGSYSRTPTLSLIF